MTIAQMALGLPARPPTPFARELLGGVLGVAVHDVLERVRVAEEEIAAADLPPELRSAAFGVLIPTAPLRGKGIDLYRAHARELVARLARGEDTAPGTLAECLSAGLEAALVAPLRQEGQALVEWMYGQVFPEHAAAIGCGEARERWNGQVQEDLAVLRRKLASRRSA